MRTLLVTGGAGFIGSNFVRHVIEHTDLSVTVLDKLTYAASRDSIADLPVDRCRLVVGDICDAALVDELVSAPRRRGALRRRVAQRQLAERPDPVRADQPGRHVHAARGGPPARRALPPHLHRRGLRRPRPRRPAPIHRVHALRAVEPVLVDQGRLGPAGRRLGALVRRPRHDQQLLQQLRAVPARREVHPPPDHPAHRRPAAQACTATGLNVRDWIHVEDHSSAVLPILQRRRDRRDVPDRRRRRAEQPRGRRGAAGDLRPRRPTTSSTSRTAPATTCATRSTRTKLRTELGWRPTHGDVEGGLADTVEWYRDHEQWWRSAKIATEQIYARQGQ